MLIHPGLGLGPQPRLSYFSGRCKNGPTFFRAERCCLDMRHSCLALRIATISPLEIRALMNFFAEFKNETLYEGLPFLLPYWSIIRPTASACARRSPAGLNSIDRLRRSYYPPFFALPWEFA
jgi:hypothetical protein